MRNRRLNLKLTGVIIPVLLLLSTGIFSQYSAGINGIIRNVREASYQDSARLFKTGKEAQLKIAGSGSPEANAELLIFYGNYFFYMRKMEKAKSFYEQALHEA